MRYARIIHRVAEVAFGLLKLLRGNWLVVPLLALSVFELYEVATAA